MCQDLAIAEEVIDSPANRPPDRSAGMMKLAPAKYFAAARLEQEQVVQEQKGYGPPLCVLGLIDAALGNKEAALQEGHRALELLPVERNSTDGQRLIAFSAMIAGWAGEKDVALQQLAIAVPTPGASFITSYGFLKLPPFWDPLRGDPRFEELVQRFAPVASR